MKRILLFLTVFTASFLTVNKASASHAMGVDLSYQHAFGNFYRVTLTYYRDCSGISASNSATVYFNSPSGCGTNFNEVLPLIGTGTEVSPLCPAELGNSSCNGGAIPGVEQYTYEALVEITDECDDWNLSYSECCRNDGGGLTSSIVAPTSNDIYVEALLDNTAGLNNSSPQFTTLPVPYICSGQDFTYNHGAYDPDGDSLVYTLIAAQDGPYPGTNIGYNAPASPTNPVVGVANVFDSQTGSIVVNPDGTDELVVMVILVEEYRNGVVIGSTMRDIQVVVQACTNIQPADDVPGLFSQVGGVNVDGNSIEVCPGEALSFDIRYNDANGDDITMVTNLGAVIPGATFTAGPTVPSGMASTATGSFSWTPTGADAGFHSFTVTVQDDGCPILGSQVFAYDILVQDGTYAGADQTYCPGGVDPQLAVTGGTVFNWTYLGDGDGGGMAGASVPVNANFDCNPCSNPIPHPGSATTYIVTSNLSSLCKNKDTVTVSTNAGFALTMPANQTICLNEGVNLPLGHPGGTYTYDWSPITALSNPVAQNPLASPTTTTTYTATVTDNATGCRNQDDVDVTVSGVGPGVQISNDTNICAGDPVPLLAVPYSTECDNYSVSSIGFGTTAGGGWTSLTGGDSYVSGALPLGFTFDYFCDSYTEVYASSNGGLIFNNTSSYQSSAIPSTLGPENFIAFAHADLVSTTMRYKSTATYFVFQYQGYNYWEGSGSSSVSAEIRLYSDGSNNIEIHIQDLTPGTEEHLCGIENIDGTAGLSPPSRNYGVWSASNEAWRFAYPQTTGPYNYTWNGGLASSANPTATPGSTITYIVDVEDSGTGCRGTASVDVAVGAAFNLATTPSTLADRTICYGNSVSLNTAPDAGGAYSYSWSPTNDLLNNFTASPTATPTGTTKFYVDVDNGGCIRRDSVTIDVLGTPINASIDKDSICPGEVVQLDVAANPSFCGVTSPCGGTTVLHTLGTSAGTTGTTPYEGFYSDGRMQMLYTVADLNSLGVTPGVITEIAFRVSTNGSTQAYNNFTISMAGVSLANLGGFQAGTTPVYGPTNYTVSAIGWQTHVLDSPFSWDGTCDLLVEVCFDNSSYTSDDDVNYTTTPYTSVAYAYADGSATGGCGETLDGTSSSRPFTRFRVCSSVLPGGATYSWTGPVSSASAQNPTSTPSSSVTYDVTVDDGSCITTTQTRVGVDQTNVAAVADNNVRCSGEVANITSALSQVIPPICDSYTVASTTYSWITAATAGWTMMTADMTGDFGYTDASENIPIGFDFDFYCNTYNNVYGNANGFLSFTALTGSGGYTVGIPDATTANNQIAFATEDLVCNGAGYRLDGAAPNRIFTFMYTGYHYNETTERIRVQVRLHETSNVIEIMAREIDEDASFASTMSMGIENSDGSAGLVVPGRNNTSWTASNEGWRFTPDAGATYSWSPATGLDDATAANPVYTAPDNNSRDFIVTVTGGMCELKDTVTIGCVLPLDLLSFEAKRNRTKVDLNWELASTTDLKKFVVERSNDGKKFFKISDVFQNGQSSKFFAVDENPLDGNNYYRLKMIENDESYVYSNVKEIFFDKKGVFNIYPNPSLGEEIISFDFKTNGNNVDLQLTDITGRLVKTDSYFISDNINTLSFSASDIPEGVYIYKIQTSEEEYYGKLIINK